MSTTTAINFPIHLADFTDAGLRRIEAACRAERLRRAGAAARPADPDDEALEQLPRDVLTGLAERMARDVRGQPAERELA